MKEPKLKDLVDAPDLADKIKSSLGTATKTRITINIDTDVLNKIKNQAEKERLPYQHLLNKFLGEHLEVKKSQEKWRTKIEKEITTLKEELSELRAS